MAQNEVAEAAFGEASMASESGVGCGDSFVCVLGVCVYVCAEKLSGRISRQDNFVLFFLYLFSSFHFGRQRNASTENIVLWGIKKFEIC